MAISTGSVNLPAGSSNTHGVNTAIVTAIRHEIEPQGGWWQVQLRPWHYWTAIGSTAVTAAAFLLLISTIGMHR